MNSTLAKYTPAIIQLAIVLVGALAQLTGHITLVDGLQLIPLAANVVGVYFLPLLGDAQRSGAKTALAVVGALVAAGIPFAANHAITGAQVAIVILAGLQVLGAHVGVQIRNDAAAFGLSPSGTALPAARIASEPPTETTVQKAIDVNSGEFMGEAAR